MAEHLVEVEDLAKRFGLIEALSSRNPVSFHVEEDELLVVLGPTGAGKTTLLRTMAGLETPDSGKIIFAGQSIVRQSPAARDFALVFQNFSLYPTWKVRENLAFPLRAPGRKLSKAQIAQRIESAAGILKITPLLDRKSTLLSGGEMQRVAVGRAIVRRPRLFLLDEPLSNLDAKLREALRVELVELRRRLGVPMIFVTHDQAEALSMADRIVVLSEGRLLQTGPPREIYDHPVSPTVARLLGQPAINLIEVTRCNGQWVTGAGVAVMPALENTPQRMVLGVRPENIAIEGGKDEGLVEVVEDMGPIKVLAVAWAATNIHIVTAKTTQVQPGDQIFPKIDPSRAILWRPQACGELA